MNEDLRENLPIFAALVFGGLIILGLAGAVLYLQFRGVSSDVKQIEQTKPTAKPAANVPTGSVDAAIVGTWWDPDHEDGDRGFVFQSNGRYTEQYFYKGSVWPRARGGFEYDSQTRSLTLHQEDIYQFATFDPPVPLNDLIPYQVNRLTDSEICLEGKTSKGMYGCLALVRRGDKARPASDPNFSERKPNPIIGSWESEHTVISGEGGEFFGGEGTEIYIKWVFAADGAFQSYFVNTSKPQVPPFIEGAYRVGTYQVQSGNKIDVIGFTEFHVGSQDRRNMIGNEQAEFVQLFNLRIIGSNRICINEPLYPEPSKMREDQWRCFNRSSQ